MFAGMLESNFVTQENIMVSSKTTSTIDKVQQQYGIETTLENRKVASFADILFIAVKPHLYSTVLQEVKDFLNKEAIVITIAAGIDFAYMAEQIGADVKIIRSMPNTPSLVGEGMSVICPNPIVSLEELEYVKGLFASFGKVEVIEEHLMDYIPSISGSSPAYVYMFIEALADGGVRSGIPRATAYKLAAQSVLGAAKMVLETGKHPGVLKDEVCTPGGTTIEAIVTLEQKHFKGAILAAMESCDLKNKAMKNK